MRKLLAVAFVATLAVGLLGCGNSVLPTDPKMATASLALAPVESVGLVPPGNFQLPPHDVMVAGPPDAGWINSIKPEAPA